MPWWYWTILGLTLIGIEALTLGALGNFYFLFLGLAGILTGLGVALQWIPDLWMQGVTFAALTLVFTWVFTRWFSTPPLAPPGASDTINSLIGDLGTSTTVLQPGFLGSVEIRGAQWFAKSDTLTTIEPHTPIVVTKMEGITLWVKPIGQPVSQQPIGDTHS